MMGASGRIFMAGEMQDLESARSAIDETLGGIEGRTT